MSIRQPFVQVVQLRLLLQVEQPIHGHLRVVYLLQQELPLRQILCNNGLYSHRNNFRLLRNRNVYSYHRSKPGCECQFANHLCRIFCNTYSQWSYHLYLVASGWIIRNNRNKCYSQSCGNNGLYRYRNNRWLYRNGNSNGYGRSESGCECQLTNYLRRSKCYIDGHRSYHLYLVACRWTFCNERSICNGKSCRHNSLYRYRNYRKLFRNGYRNGYGRSDSGGSGQQCHYL